MSQEQGDGHLRPPTGTPARPAVTTTESAGNNETDEPSGSGLTVFFVALGAAVIGGILIGALLWGDILKLLGGDEQQLAQPAEELKPAPVEATGDEAPDASAGELADDQPTAAQPVVTQEAATAEADPKEEELSGETKSFVCKCGAITEEVPVEHLDRTFECLKCGEFGQIGGNGPFKLTLTDNSARIVLGELTRLDWPVPKKDDFPEEPEAQRMRDLALANFRSDEDSTATVQRYEYLLIGVKTLRDRRKYSVVQVDVQFFLPESERTVNRSYEFYWMVYEVVEDVKDFRSIDAWNESGENPFVRSDE